MHVQSVIDGLEKLAICNPGHLFAYTDQLKNADLCSGPFHVSIFRVNSAQDIYRVYTSIIGEETDFGHVTCGREDLSSAVKAGCYIEAGWYAIKRGWSQDHIDRLAALRQNLHIEVKHESHVRSRFVEGHPFAVSSSGVRDS